MAQLIWNRGFIYLLTPLWVESITTMKINKKSKKPQEQMLNL